MRIVREGLVIERDAGRLLAWKIALPSGVVTAHMTVKIDSEQTSGGFFITETYIPPGGFIPPHRHEQADEVAYVVEGELGLMVGDKEFQAGPGSFSVRPRGLPHALWNTGARPVRAFDIGTPGTFMAGFEELDRRFSSTPATFDELIEVSRQHDTIWMLELAPALAQKHGLRM